MKVVFAGPSLPDAALHADNIEVRGPAALGDLAKAVLDGAAVVGLIDGFFENVASIWHKEILYALSRGVQVMGAASMGALRAAECAPYGMIGIGEVFEAYASGSIVDDDAVGQVHGPEELGYVALSEPLVNIEATLAVLQARSLLAGHERDAIAAAARATFFKQRNYREVLSRTHGLSPERREEIAALAGRYRRDVKRDDALALLERVKAAPDRLGPPPAGWKFAETQMWSQLLDGWRGEHTGREHAGSRTLRV